MFKFPLVTPIFLDFNNLNHARFFFQRVGPEAEVNYFPRYIHNNLVTLLQYFSVSIIIKINNIGFESICRKRSFARSHKCLHALTRKQGKR